MMKNFKLFLLSFVFIAGVLTSCTNDDAVVETQDIQESAAITASLERLSQQYNSQGDVIPTSNPTGNIVFDFCFDFVYPLDLSYNNGSTVTVSSLDDLVDILINSTQDLYISGIAFPFSVETYDENADAIVVVAINNEAEFLQLLEDCNFDVVDACDCYEVYDPVCVEVVAPDGVTFLMTYPNACYAECDGFTEEDFAENCEEDYNCPGGTECFSFNFPLTIITDDGQTVTVNSQEELDNALYNAYYFDFQYPFDVTLEDGTVVTVTGPESFVSLLEDCFGGNGQGDCVECQDEPFDPVCVEFETPNGVTEIIVFPNACFAECEGFSAADFVECDNNTNDCSECEDLPFDPVCIQTATGTITFPNACYAECEGYTENDFVDCENQSSNCSEQEIAAYLTSCDWYINTSLYQNVTAEYAEFAQDGSVSIFTVDGNSSNSGTWEITSNPATGELFMFFMFNDAPHDAIALLDWTVTECGVDFIVLTSGNDFIMLERDCQ